MFIPRFIRNFIPLRFWPEWCNTQQRFYDLIIEMVEEHNESWKVGEEAHCLIGVLEEDRQAGRITESDVIHTIFALFLGKHLISKFMNRVMQARKENFEGA